MLSLSLKSFLLMILIRKNWGRFEGFPTISCEAVRTTEEWIWFLRFLRTYQLKRGRVDSGDFRIFLYNFIGVLILPVLIHTNSKKNPTYDENSTLVSYSTVCARTFQPELALFGRLSCFTRPNHVTGIRSWNSLFWSIFLLFFFLQLRFHPKNLTAVVAYM